MEYLKEIVVKLQESGRFEGIEMYENREELLQRFLVLYPQSSYEKQEQTIGKDKKIYVLFIVNQEQSRYNLYTEDDLLTLEHLLESGETLI